MISRVGLIIPSSNRMVEQEMVGAFAPDVQAHVTRLRMTGANHLPFGELLPRIEEAGRALADARCDVIAFHCTANSMEAGAAGERAILAALLRAGAPRATTTITAVQRALDALAARRIVLLTPYDAATTEHEAAFLRAAGYDVLSAVGYALAGSDAYCSTPAQFWRDRAIETAYRDADACFISCANIAVFGVIEELEARLGCPVITSNQAVIWDVLCLLSRPEQRPGLGRLFERMPSEPPTLVLDSSCPPRVIPA
jgi:maleate isomerase